MKYKMIVNLMDIYLNDKMIVNLMDIFESYER